MPIIQVYLDTRDDELLPESPLFMATPRGQRAANHSRLIDKYIPQPLSTRAIRKLVKTYAKRANLDAITPHSLRHTTAMQAAEHGTVTQVSKLLRHKNVNITTIYLDHMDIERADELADDLASLLLD
ncbi:MAG: tyrosine-type recombinase/integrase [Chloroflexota bacterium]